MNPQEIKSDELKKALQRLKEALALPKSDIVRDSVIQRFEFTVELSWKLLYRHLKAQGFNDNMTPKNLIREAAKLNIIQDPESWLRFIDARNLSSHTYREDLAEQVFASAKLLPPFVDDLIKKLESSPFV